MDSGKIMMGTALLLITISLLAHPAGAAGIDTASIGELVTGTTEAGTIYEDCPAGSLFPVGFSGNATLPYKQLIRSPAPGS